MESPRYTLSLKQWMWLATLVGCSVLVMPPRLQAQRSSGETLLSSLRNNVVRIAVERGEGGSDEGFGFIVGQRANTVFIVTANHVVRGKGPGPESLLRKVTIEYFQDRGNVYKATLLGTSDPNLDVAVLQAGFPQGLTPWVKPALGSLSDVNRGTPVWFIGRAKEWYTPVTSGRINEVTPDLRIIVENLNVQPGTSGAPLIARSGVIGMVVEDAPGAESHAVSIDSIKRAFERWNHPWGLEPLQQGPSGQTSTTPQTNQAPTPPRPRAEEGRPEPTPTTPQTKQVTVLSIRFRPPLSSASGTELQAVIQYSTRADSTLEVWVEEYPPGSGCSGNVHQTNGGRDFRVAAGERHQVFEFPWFGRRLKEGFLRVGARLNGNEAMSNDCLRFNFRPDETQLQR
jgi:Trypsin-like peptidase domain